MRLIRFGPMGKERPGILSDDGARRNLSEHFTDWDCPFFSEGGLAHLANFVARILWMAFLWCGKMNDGARQSGGREK